MSTINRAFQLTPREYFLPDERLGSSVLDIPLPIGFGQTNSQPSTVELMLEWLEVEEGNRILDVGCGSGWTTALLAQLTGSNGCVFGVDIIPELVDFARQNLVKLSVQNAGIFLAHKHLGLPQFAPYDRILVSATAQRLPQELLNQLAQGGRMVIPVKNDILTVMKNDEISIISHPGFAFVPLIDSQYD